MPHLKYQIKKRLTRLVSKHYRGFGIDSPYVYHLIREVIEAKMHYYPFKKLERQSETVRLEIKNKLTKNDFPTDVLAWYESEIEHLKRSVRLNRFLFRLVNFLHPEKLAFIGDDSGVNLSYLAKVDSRRDVFCLNSKSVAKEFSQQVLKDNAISNVIYSDLESCKAFDFIQISRFVSDDVLIEFETHIDQYLNEPSFLVVENIHKDKKRNALWNRLKHKVHFNVSLDLFDVGILIAQNDLKKRDYILSVKCY